MRAAVLATFAVTLAGCGELRGSTEFTDAFFEPGDTGAAKKDAAGPRPNSLSGDYYDYIIPETLGAFRLDRRKEPTKPWIIFVSMDGDASITCASFSPPDWNRKLPGGAIIHVIELGTNAAGEYTVEKYSPPGPRFAAVGRATPTATDWNPEYAIKGSVSIIKWDTTSASGTLNVEFPAYFPSDEVDAGPVAQFVRGSFDVTSCAVDW